MVARKVPQPAVKELRYLQLRACVIQVQPCVSVGGCPAHPAEVGHQLLSRSIPLAGLFPAIPLTLAMAHAPKSMASRTQSRGHPLLVPAQCGTRSDPPPGSAPGRATPRLRTPGVWHLLDRVFSRFNVENSSDMSGQEMIQCRRYTMDSTRVHSRPLRQLVPVPPLHVLLRELYSFRANGESPD